MGFTNHLILAQRHKALFDPPYLEVGSKDYGNTANLRGLFNDGEYVGLDMTEGSGVNLVLDLTRPFDEIEEALEGRRFGSIFCLSVMEHCDQPFIMAENMTRLLKPGGRVFISVPFAWKFHGFPSDYWRFTHEGVKKLFPRIEFDETMCNCCTHLDNDFRPLDHDLCALRIKGTWHRRNGHFVRSISADILSLLGTLGPIRWLTRYRYVMVPTMINMIGTLRET